MFRKRKGSSPDGGGYSGKVALAENFDLMFSQDSDDKLSQSDGKVKWQDKKLFHAANSGFSITEPTYDFKHLDSPCTITRSSLVPVLYEEKQSVASFSDELTQDVSIQCNTPLVECASDTGPACSSNVPPPDNQNISVAASSSSDKSTVHRRQLRRKRKTFTKEECPICGVTVRLQDVREHYKCELKKLDSLKKRLKKPSKEFPCPSKKLEQVKANRSRRSLPSGAREMKDAAVSTCMVCNPELLDDESVVHARALVHLTECVGVEEDLLEEALQEYSLEDESQRIMSYVDHIDSMSYNRIENAEDDSHIIVDSDDDDIAYGSPQFTEQDLIVCESSLSDSAQAALREAVLSLSDDDIPPPLEVPPANPEDANLAPCIPNNFYEGSDVDENESRNVTENNQCSSLALVSALKSRIEELEEQLQTRSASKCNICLENYKKPLVSVSCWHVSCEECWMKTLGSKKLCPQCAKIILPTSLRRIYL